MSKSVFRDQALQVADGARFIIGAPKSILTKPFNPAELPGLGTNWKFWRGPADGDGLTGEEDRDERSLAIAKIDPTRIIFETCLKGSEILIGGERKLRRFKEKTEIIRLGGNAFLGLWLDYQANKKNSVLEWFYRTWKITYLDFFGDILRDPNRGDRCVLYFNRHGVDPWDWHVNWLENNWRADSPSAGLTST